MSHDLHNICGDFQSFVAFYMFEKLSI